MSLLRYCLVCWGRQETDDPSEPERREKSETETDGDQDFHKDVVSNVIHMYSSIDTYILERHHALMYFH